MSDFEAQAEMDQITRSECDELAERIAKLEAVREAAQRLIDCDPLRRQGHEFPSLKAALQEVDDGN